MFYQYRTQSENLADWFGAAAENAQAANEADLAGGFTNLRDAENSLRALTASNSVTFANYPAEVEKIRNGILNGLIGNGGTTDRTEFDKYLNAYTAGHYVINRDWQTELQGSANALDGDHAAVKAFTDARAALNDNTKYPDDTNNAGDAVTNIPIGGGLTVETQLGRMEDEMAQRITARFGLTGANATNMKDVARALVIQLGQDLPELKVFLADMTAEPTIDHKGRLGRVPSAYMQPLSQANMRSDVLLARVDAKFPPEKAHLVRWFENWAQ
jgi:hypothetical protein